MEAKVLDINEKQNVAYCIPLSLRDEQIKINLQKVKGRVENNPELVGEPIAIVGFAPSLNQTWEELKKFKYIMTCSGAHKFLVERGIVPTHHVDLDPRLHKLKLLGEPQKETQYLIASTIHPQYLDKLEGYNVKLWHIFANEDEGSRVLPRGEWSLTGGSSVGLRCLTLARFLGFTDMHVFGMDGSFVEGSTHTAEHPNAPKEAFVTEYNGKKFLTTPSILHVAKETFHELDEMPDCTFKFYGEGLVQEMAKDYKPAGKNKSLIAYTKPELISKEYIELNRKLHQDNPGYGMGGDKHAAAVLKLSEANNTTDILDYGAGKMMLQKALPFPIFNYDPAVPEISKYPRPANIVVCTDVLEHIEPDKLKFVLDDLKFLVKKIGYFVISTRKAVKTYANGQNAHLIVKDRNWWKKYLEKFFEVAMLPEKQKDQVEFVVGPKLAVVPEMEVVEKDGVTTKFYTPNDTTKWRAKSLYTKEPATIDWINSMKAGDVLYDVGANVGSYSVLAGAKGLKVYSFEPESQNYSILVKNLQLNNIEPNAYCLALSDAEKPGLLYLSGQQEAGGACHSFNESVGHDLTQRPTALRQGVLGIPLDTLIEQGLPSPKHIKIDVDGFEYKVVKGAEKTLANGVQSVLIEINPALEEHKEMIKFLENLGYSYDVEQVKKAERKDGTFKGVAEYIFRKGIIPGKSRIAQKVEDAPMSLDPFNYFYTENVFTEDTYKLVQEELEKATYTEIEKSRGTRGYPLRYTSYPNSDFWKEFSNGILSGEFRDALLEKFSIPPGDYEQDILLIRDLPGYQIPPHTDSLRKVVTVLIYLPEDEYAVKEGTSIFVPKDSTYIDKTGKHHSFDDFKETFRAPFKPNSMLAFARRDNSFHGVYPSKHIRNVLLYNINRK